MILEIEGIPPTPEFFAQLLQDSFDANPKTWVDYDVPISKYRFVPAGISNIELKEITENEIIMQLRYTSIPSNIKVFEITIPKLKIENVEQIEGTREFRRKPVKIKMHYLRD